MFKAYIKHRAKAFGAAVATGITGAILEAFEQTFDIQLGTETKLFIIGAVNSQVVFWLSNGPKEGTA